MRVGEINEMLHKTEELKALFVFGQRVIPFLEEVFLFIREVTPLLENINVSIEENLSKMPKAAQQLSSVTKATELATTEILDTLDGLSYKSDVISSNLKQLIQIQRLNRTEHEKVIDAVNKLQEDGQTDTEDKESVYSRLIDVIRKIEHRDGGNSSTYHVDNIKSALSVLQKPEVSEELVNNSEKLLESIRMDSTQIMMSLQVQDITSQQLAAVNSLLQTVQGKLGEIMIHFRNTEIGELITTSGRRPSSNASDESATQVSTMHRAIAYDHDVGSALNKDPNRQNDVDSIFASFQLGGAAAASMAPTSSSSGGAAGQDDIDALFGAAGITPTPPAPSAPPPSATAASAGSSQNDIDALFGSSNASGGAPSQDDIDALFKNL
jgi:chemotaxis regulatin CheY-phosphate phosphatase CheZ